MSDSVSVSDQSLPTLGDLLHVTCQAEIGRALGISRKRVWRIRHGITGIDDSLIAPLAKVLHLDVDFVRQVVENDRARKGTTRRSDYRTPRRPGAAA